MPIVKQRLVVMLIVAAFLAGCAGMPQTLEKGPSRKVQPSQEFHNTLIYVKPGLDPKRYTRFFIEPVKIYQGEDAQFQGLSEEEKKTMANFVRSEFIRALKKSFEVVNEPGGPGVLRIRLILGGVQQTVAPLATVTHVLPAGLVMNLGLSAAHLQGSFMGSVVFGAEFLDGQTGALQAAFLTKKSPNAMDLTTLFTGLDAAKQAVKESAETLRETMVQMQKEGKEVR